ncbi:MAG: restriction endonuclease [Oscillospiraceae bacterium]|nr:restriction endonuclease [Oscillospiraceae bacterium]
MNGRDFERFIANLFEKMGYKTKLTKASGDQGIDVIAESSDERIGIQAKCYSSKVGNSAIQEVVAGKAFYKLDKVMVITNNRFTSSAIDLARANNVILWDRNNLKDKLK